VRASVLLFGLLFISGLLSAQDITPRNSIIVESNLIAMSSISYNRIVVIKEKTLLFGGGYVMGTGFGYGSNWIKAETSLLSFGPKHFLETGVLFIYGIDDDSSPGIKLAYRFRSKTGITLTADAYVLFNIDPAFMPALGIGYSF